MGSVSFCFENCHGFGTNFQRLSATIDMAVVVSRLNSWACQQGVIALPCASTVRREDGNPPWILIVERDSLRGQQKMIGEWRIAQ
jgi:hypothetical protein